MQQRLAWEECTATPPAKGAHGGVAGAKSKEGATGSEAIHAGNGIRSLRRFTQASDGNTDAKLDAFGALSGQGQ